MKKITSLVLALLLALSMTSGFAAAESKLWTEEDMPDGWTKIVNEGGATLGYSKDSGLQIIEADGYAFKDLNGNGELDVYEDWRNDYKVRAQALAESGELSTEFMMGMKMNPMSIGTMDTEEIPEEFKTALQLGYRHLRYRGGSVEDTVTWNNMLQEYIESLGGVVIPSTFLGEQLSENVSTWPSNLGIAATFDPEIAAAYGRIRGAEYRALGVTMEVSPQVDLATEPRWSRIDGTFGEDPQLAMDMARAMVNGWQSTYDEEGNDLGWGKDSVNTQVKHLWGEGAAEAGREAHTPDGAYNVYPGGNQWTHLLPYLATLDLPGLTEETAAAMTNFSVAVDANGDSIGGDRVATSFNEWKLNEVWRKMNNWDGYILNDFNTHYDKPYGVEDLSTAERLLQMLVAGVDAFGALGRALQDDVDLAMEAYNIGVEKYGQEEMDQIMVDSTRHILQTLFNVGIVDNPYLSLEESLAVTNITEYDDAGLEALRKSIVMVKNTDNIIAPAGEEKLTVYIPWKFTPATEEFGNITTSSWAPCVDVQTAMKYFNVVTDKAGAPSGTDESGNPMFTEDDIIRATDEEIASCDFALVRIASPQDGNPTKEYVETNPDAMYAYNGNTKANDNPEEYTYRPISLQYRPYTADNMYVRLESIGGDIIEREVEGVYGPEIVVEKENRSYYGQTAIITNEADLDLVLDAAARCDKVVVCIDAAKPMVFNEFESEVDAIIMSWSGGRSSGLGDEVLLEIVAGQVEPSGLLPMQMPANMETVEAQYEDVPRDMECHVDSDGNTYDFAFGMNWSGVINDERVAKYNVEPISVDETTVQEYFNLD